MWDFRPSALQTKGYATARPDDLLVLYHQDNLRAVQQNVSNPPRCSFKTTLQTCQWNVHCFIPYLMTTNHSSVDPKKEHEYSI
jgi:hypothetical protein